MKKFSDKGKGVLVSLVFLLIVVQVPAYLLSPYGTVGLFLIGFSLLLLAVAISKGPVTALFWCLPYLFLLGTILFYSHLSINRLPIAPIGIPLPFFLVYGLLLIVLIIIAGKVHEQFMNQQKQIVRLREKIRQFVAVDPETGFDNRERMKLEVTSEMKRIDRYGGAFVLLFLQVEHYEEFGKLYGEKERVHVLSSIAQVLQEMLRMTDRKFRYARDCFAVELTNTTDASLETVIEKLRERLKTHQLLNGKYIDLSFHIGFVLYDGSSFNVEYEELLEKVESEMIAHAI